MAAQDTMGTWWWLIDQADARLLPAPLEGSLRDAVERVWTVVNPWPSEWELQA